MKIKISILSENTAHGEGILGEHGLSYSIRRGDTHVLFDTGQGLVLQHNARRMGVPLDDVAAVALSHGHYDHTGGLLDVLEESPEAMVYAHPAALRGKFSRRSDGKVLARGLPERDQVALADGDWKVTHTVGPTDLPARLTLSGEIPRLTDFEGVSARFFQDEACTLSDPVPDDQCLFFDAKAGTIVLLGCAHAGVANTLSHVKKLTGGRKIHAVLGGTHLVSADRERIRQTVEAVLSFEPDIFGPAHCTGPAATAAFWSGMPRKCVACGAGTELEFDV